MNPIRKILIFLLISVGLLSMSFSQEKGNPIEILNIYSSVQNSKTKIIFQTSSYLPLPLVYNSKVDPSILVIEFENVRVSTPKRDYTINSPCVNKIRIYPLPPNMAKAEIKLLSDTPYRLYTSPNNVTIEFNRAKEVPRFQVQREKVEEKPISTKNSESHSEVNNPTKKNLTQFLQDIKIEKNEENLEVMLIMNGDVTYKCFELSNPERIVVDLFEVINTAKPSYQIGGFGVARIRTGQFQSNPSKITRVVFDIISKPRYKISKNGNNLAIKFYPLNQNYSSSLKKEETYNSPPKYNSSPKNETAVIKSKKLDVKPEEKPVEKPLKKEIESNTNTTTNTTSGKQKQKEIYKEPQQEIFTPKTISGEETKYKGERVNLRFKDADLRDVVIYLGTVAGLNVVFDPGVSGRVTCDLIEIPWDQALEIILKSNKLGMVLEGNVLRIASIETLAREEEQARRLREAKELAGPIKILTRTLSYARVGQIKPILDRQLSKRGEIIIDDRSNTLIISDIPDRVSIIEKLIETLDVPNPQVSIEARIVEATSNFARNLGIQWGFRAIADAYYGNQTSLQFPNSIAADGSKISGLLAKGLEGPLGGYAINLPAPVFDTAIGISFGNVLDTFRLDMALSALETSGEGRIISAPKITAQNNMKAEIIQGRQIPVQTVANFTVSTRYVNAALELRVTPQITAEGTIIMEIEIRNNAADFANLVNGIPPIITQSATTTVEVKDGGTAVIGGIYRTEDNISRNRVPFLHKIPIIGNLFKSFSRTRQNRELLIFITPRIVRG